MGHFSDPLCMLSFSTDQFKKEKWHIAYCYFNVKPKILDKNNHINTDTQSYKSIYTVLVQMSNVEFMNTNLQINVKDFKEFGILDKLYIIRDDI